MAALLKSEGGGEIEMNSSPPSPVEVCESNGTSPGKPECSPSHPHPSGKGTKSSPGTNGFSRDPKVYTVHSIITCNVHKI